MKNRSNNMKKGLSLALTAMMIFPTTTSAFAEKVSTPSNGDDRAVKTGSIPYNMLNQNGLSNPVSTAKPAKNPMKIYTSMTMSLSSNAGDGSSENPYNRFEDAIAQVADGGTIYILASKGAFLNAQDEYGHKPFLIDKNVTIKPAEGAKNAHLTVRAGGILLGADVKFENITLSFANKYHDSIFANGHTLDLINVTRPSGSRKIDLFAGGLYERSNNVDKTTPIYPSGTEGVINVETNDNFSGGTYNSTFGNIYGGSMNGVFEGSAEINISNNGTYNKLDLGSIKSSGALEADTGNMFDMIEPSAPAEDPNKYPTKGNVTVNLKNYQVGVDGTTGSDGKTNVTTSSVYPSDIDLESINHLTVEMGIINAVYRENITIPNVTVKNGATLDLTKAGTDITVENYDGDGTITLKRDAKLIITKSMSGNMNFQTEGAFNGRSGLVAQDHAYITAPNDNANISFEPNTSQSYLELTKHRSGSTFEWKAEKKIQDTLSPLTNLSIKSQDARQTWTYSELNFPSSTEDTSYITVDFPLQVTTVSEPDPDVAPGIDLNEYPFEISVNGRKAIYRKNEVDPDESYYFADGLNLAISFGINNIGDKHVLTMHGSTADGKLTEISKGSYEFNVSHVKEDGTLLEFTSYLTVTNDVQQDDTKTGTSFISFGKINNPKLGGILDIPVSIMHDTKIISNAVYSEIGKAYLYVNGIQVAEMDVTPSQQSDLTFNNINVTTANNFKLGNNEVSVTYSGTDTYNGSVASYWEPVQVGKALPTLTVLSNTDEVYDYDGTGRELAPDVSDKVIVSVGGETVSEHEEKVLYQNTSIQNSMFTDELPVFPGIYNTKIVVSEGETYEREEVDGPTITINKVKPQVKVSGVVKNGRLTVTAQVSSSSTAIMPNGAIEFYVDGVLKDTVDLVNGVAEYTLDRVTGSTKATSNNGVITTPSITVKYTDKTIIDEHNNTNLYEETESEPIKFTVSDNWVNVDSVEVDQNVIELNINGIAKLKAIVNPTDASNTDVVWSIDNNKVANISKNGVVTALSEGIAYVNVRTVDGGHEATAIVKVTDKIDNIKPPTDNGNGDGTPEPPTDDGINPPTDNGNGGNGGGTPEPPIDGGINPPTDNGNGGNGGGTPEPPIDGGINPPTDNGNGGNGGGTLEPPIDGSINPPTGNGNGGNGDGSETTPPSGYLTESENGDLIIEIVPGKLAIDDTVDIVIDEDSIQIGSGDKQYNSSISNGLPSYSKKRVFRDEGNGVFTSVPYFVEDGKLHIKTKYPHGLVITDRIVSNFNDTKGLFSENEIEDLYNYLIVNGTTATTFSPNAHITRGQFSVMIARALELKPKGDKYTLEDTSMKWYADEVHALYETGIISGFPDGTFGGDEKLTRQQAATMINRMLEYMKVDTTPTEDIELGDMELINDYAIDAVKYLASKDVLNSGEDINFNPSNNLTRAQMAKILMRSLQISDWY